MVQILLIFFGLQSEITHFVIQFFNGTARLYSFTNLIMFRLSHVVFQFGYKVRTRIYSIDL